MIIRNITKIKNNVKILLDNDEHLIIRYEVFLTNGLRKGDELNEQLVSSLIRQNKVFWARESAFRFLGLRLHSQKELERKLLNKKYDRDIIESVISYMLENSYLDDERFAREYTEEKVRNKLLGPNRIRQELRSKGVASDIVESVLTERETDNEFDNALRLGQKKLKSYASREQDKRKLAQKLFVFLSSKGFGFDLIKQVVKQLLDVEEQVSSD